MIKKKVREIDPSRLGNKTITFKALDDGTLGGVKITDPREGITINHTVRGMIDQYLVDGLVNLVGRIPVAIGSSFRALQNGVTPFYAMGMVLGLLVLVAAILVSWGLIIT